jgi:hypothetical protein
LYGGCASQLFTGRRILRFVLSFLIAGLQMRTYHHVTSVITTKREANMLFRGGFTYTNFLADVFSVFIFVLWFWLLITVFGDLFRRRDVSGLAKAL